MRPNQVLVIGAAIAMLAAGCSDDVGAPLPSTTTTTTTTTTAPETTTTTEAPTTTATPTTTSDPPSPVCDAEPTLAVVDAALETARLDPGGVWSTEVGVGEFLERATTADEYASRLGLDCGVVAAQTLDDGHQRLVIAAWTGDRSGFVVQASDGPSNPYAPEATFSLGIDSARGEFVDGDARSIWAGTVDSGETFIVGHVDHALGAIAKDWVAGDRNFDDFVSLDAERHAIAALEEANMRNISIAELPHFESEEGYVQFTSPAGQLLVVDVAPTDWFDPLSPRYFTGPTSFETIEGVEVRVTEPTADDNLGFIRGAEWGWSCGAFVWILQPPWNGDAAEMRASVEAIVATTTCGAD